MFRDLPGPGGWSRVGTMVRSVPTTHYPGYHYPVHHHPAVRVMHAGSVVQWCRLVHQASFGFNTGAISTVHAITGSTVVSLLGQQWCH